MTFFEDTFGVTSQEASDSLKKNTRDPGSPGPKDGKCPVAVPALGYPCAWEFNGDPQ